MATNTWFQLTVVGDSQGVAMWLDGTRLISSVPAGNSVITDMSQKVDQGNNQVLLSSTYVNEDATTAPVYRHTADFIAASNQVGAWKDAGWCGLGFDMSNVRFTDRALFSSLDSTVAFPSVPLQVVDGTSLLINTTTPALSLNSSDSSNRQSLTNWGFETSRWVSATTDREAPVIEVTSAPVQTVSPGEPVSCEVSSTGGAIASYEVSPAPGPGLTFSSTSGVLRGTPSASGTTSYTITGFNNSGSVSSSCTITVSNSSSGGGFSSGGSGLTVSPPPVSPPQIKSATSAVYFAPNSALLDKASKKVLRGLVAKLKNSTQLYIRIDGHADSIVGLMPNSVLAAARAKVVAKYLRARVQNATFFVRAFSAKRPAVLGKSTKAYSLNRRSVISATFSQ
jgi:outer membrane protein OmpA-like peptidoglycan-associated protein